MERRKQCSPGCRCRRGSRRQQARVRHREDPSHPASSETLACTDVSGMGTGRSPLPPRGPSPGPHREDRRSSPMMNGAEKSDPLIVPMKPANKAAQAVAEPAEGSGGTKRNADRQSTDRTQGRAAVSQAQARIRGAVSRNRTEKLTALLHHVSIEVLEWAFFSLKKRAAPGVDGRTWDQYATDLEANLADLHARVHAGTYRALPSRRKYIPKADGRQRPLGIAAIEDKIVQAAVVALLTPIYEAEFLGFSYGFRPGRSQHDALDALAYGIKARKVNWILDADVRSFFDTLSREWLVRFVEHRIGDRRIIRLIQKWLKAGVLEEGLWMETMEGVPQGSVASPLLANVYLHDVYDLWVQQWRLRHATGDMIVVRYADDVRHFTGRWIPFTERRGLEETTLGPTAYPAAKAKGDRSMPAKRERLLRDNQNHVRCVNQASLTLVSFIHRKLHPAIMMSCRQTAVKPSPSGSRRWRLRA